MRKEAYYLPNLSSLITQNRQYQRHRQKVKQSKSQIQINILLQTQHKQSVETMQAAIKKLTNIEILHPIRDKQGKKVQLRSHTEANQRYEQTPYQKRMQEQHQRENLRMGKALDLWQLSQQLSSPTIQFPRRKEQQSHSAIKQRISKYTKEGGKVIYKFKRSLIELQKKKNLKEEYMSERLNGLEEKTKGRVESLLQESSKLKGENKTQCIQGNDIFYNDGASIRLNKDTSGIKLKSTIQNRSFTPQNYLAIHSHLDYHSNKAKTDSYTIDNSKSVTTDEQHRNAKTQLLQFRRLNRDIILNNHFNPEKSKDIMKKQRKRSKLAELEIIQIPSVSN